jgi:hypothetical protein
MRAHMNTTARAGAEARTKRTILALGLAVALFAATASTASTTPTPPAPPLTLSVNGAHVGQRHENLKFGRGDKKTLYFGVITSNDSTLVATGDVEKTTTQVAAALEQCPEGFDGGPPAGPGECCSEGPHAGCISSTRRIEAKLKHWKRLIGKPRFKAKIKVTATDEFGQTTSDKVKFVLRRCPKTIRLGGGESKREALYSTGTPESCVIY